MFVHYVYNIYDKSNIWIDDNIFDNNEGILLSSSANTSVEITDTSVMILLH